MGRRFRFDDRNDQVVSNELMMYMYASGKFQAPLMPQTQLATAPTSPVMSPTNTPVAPAPTTSTTTDPSTIVSPTQQTVAQPVLQVGLPPRLPDGSQVVITTPTGVSSAIPLVSPVLPLSGGGFGGGMGSSSGAETKELVTTKKKSNLFPWLLLATGVFLIVKQPLK